MVISRDFLDPLSEWATICGAVIAVVAAVAALLRFMNHRQSKQIYHEIQKATYQIQPDSNGGLSLPDVARQVNDVANDVAEIKGQVDVLVKLYKKEK